MTQKRLLLYKQLPDGSSTAFPSESEQIELLSFRYDVTRMGGAPKITATIMYPTCLDDEQNTAYKLDEYVYTIFNEEKYYLSGKPTSSKNNTDSRYSLNCTFTSEREALETVFFYDVVVNKPEGYEKSVSNSTDFSFYGDIDEFIFRLNQSLRYRNLQYDETDETGQIVTKGYIAKKDDGVTSEAKMMSFSDAVFADAIQEAYNTLGIPYYFVGKEIHFGYYANEIDNEFTYGIDDALLSMTKSNANSAIINRATGIGSGDNIPYYYPNLAPKGNIRLETNSTATYKVVDMEKFSSNMEIDHTHKLNVAEAKIISAKYSVPNIGGISFVPYENNNVEITINAQSSFNYWYKLKIKVIKRGSVYLKIQYIIDDHLVRPIDAFTKYVRLYFEDFQADYNDWDKSPEGSRIYLRFMEEGEYDILVGAAYDSAGRGFYAIRPSFALEFGEDWIDETTGKVVSLSNLGIIKESGTPTAGDTLIQRLDGYIKESSNLLPYIYRQTKGRERFYEAINGRYKYENGKDVYFPNPYIEGKPKEHILKFDDIKPTIKEVENSDRLRIDMFSEFAYDKGDNGNTYIDDKGETKYLYPYFFGKLRKMDFNLFDSILEGSEVVLSMTSGHCGACQFTIGTDEETRSKNTVQVYEEYTVDPDGTVHYAGDLKRDSNGRVICGLDGIQPKVTTFQDRQQNTIDYEVWVALKKDTDTYGVILPDGDIKPLACETNKNNGDTFVLTGMRFPDTYVIAAEKKLEAEIIKYMAENNADKFSFSITFSSIYLEENEAILKSLNENSKIKVKFNNVVYPLFIKSFSYQMTNGSVLPTITVNLDDTLSTSQSASKKAITEVKSQIGSLSAQVTYELDKLTKTKLSKTSADTSIGSIDFLSGATFGETGSFEVSGTKESSITVDYLTVLKKATFSSLEIEEITHSGGRILVTPAYMICSRVEELEDAYRCYFNDKNIDGNSEIYNKFVKGDQAICQSFNTWRLKYYWRLVTGVGIDYIDLSKTDCDGNSDIPYPSDKIIQLGNRDDATRQNAIVISAEGDAAPCFFQYKGIKDFTALNTENDERIVTKLSPEGNVLNGQVTIQNGSKGVSNFGDFAEGVTEKIKAIDLGVQNLLRNSGFTGDYLSEELADQIVLEETKTMYNSPLVHWESSGANGVADASYLSGHACEISAGGFISQTLQVALRAGNAYSIKFSATGSGTLVIGTLSVPFEGSFETTFRPTEDVTVLKITATGSLTIGNIMLVPGEVCVEWSRSPLDNQADRVYYQSLKYLADAIGRGDTVINGGLILSNIIALGNYDGSGTINSGISGIKNVDSDVAFWGGGTYDQAQATALKFIAKPSSEVNADDAKAVITHGGTAVLNDVIVHGKVYASEGEFSGTVTSTKGNIGGFDIGDGWLQSKELGPDGLSLLMGLKLSSTTLSFPGRKTTDEAYFNSLIISSTGGVSSGMSYKMYDARIEYSGKSDEAVSTGISIDVTGGTSTNKAISVSASGNADATKNVALELLKGCVAGFRPKTVFPSISPYYCDSLDNVVIMSSGQVYLPSPVEHGHILLIWHISDSRKLTILSRNETIVTMNGRSGTSIDSTNQECILLTYAYDGEYYRWYLAYFG